MKRVLIGSILTCVTFLVMAAPALAYDRDAAVDRAESHWDNVSNFYFPGYLGLDDCANFASACLYYGGINRDPDGTSGGWYCYRFYSKAVTYHRSSAWVNADPQRQYFWGKSGVSGVGNGYNF